MPQKNSCFISFRHGDRTLPTEKNLLETIIRQLKSALSSELKALTTKEVYVDTHNELVPLIGLSFTSDRPSFFASSLNTLNNIISTC